MFFDLRFSVSVHDEKNKVPRVMVPETLRNPRRVLINQIFLRVNQNGERWLIALNKTNGIEYT